MAAEIDALTKGNHGIGGIASFMGVVRAEGAGAVVVLALQPIDPRRTGVHLLTVADDIDNTARRLEVAAWGRRLRQRIEARVDAGA